MRTLLIILLLLPLPTAAQYKLKGVVRDSTGQAMPGVTVEIKNTKAQTVTGENGEFEIESTTPDAEVTFSFIGFVTSTQRINSSIQTVVELSYDMKLWEESDHFVKTSLDLGYFGDKQYAPGGFIVNYSLQSIGKVSLDLNSNFKYWKAGNNSGLDISISTDMSVRFLPENLFLGYRSFDYDDEDFTLKQTRLIMANELLRFFAIDVGASYNDLVRPGEQGMTDDQYVAGIVGITKVFSYSSFLKNWGFHASLNYHPGHTFYEAGTYKGIYIRKLPAMVLMAKYYDYGGVDGIVLSLRFNIFNTRYYCCHSWKVYYDDLNALK